MAKKNREPVNLVEPESSEESDSASSDDEQPQTTLKRTPTTNTVSKRPEVSESEEFESESEPEEPKPVTTVTPSKRPAATQKDVSKKPKIADSSKKSPFQRLFTDEDEIVILNGMIEFESKKKVSPTADIDAFIEFIKPNLCVDVSKVQLQGKIQKLKRKYLDNKGKDRSSAKPHDKAVFELSDKLWGGKEKAVVNVGNANESVVKTKKEKGSEDGEKEVVVEVTKRMGGGSSYIGLSNEEKLLRIGAEMFGGEEKVAGWEEWKKLDREEMELCVKELDVKSAKMRLVLDSME